MVEGGEVSVYYDPMIAKVIATAETRPLRDHRLADAALREFEIAGIKTNAPVPDRDPASSDAFRDGAIDTALSRSRVRAATHRRRTSVASLAIRNPQPAIPSPSIAQRSLATPGTARLRRGRNASFGGGKRSPHASERRPPPVEV